MPKLFNGMIGNDADPDVKRMALEAAERAHINHIYPDGASKQQWDAFIADYRTRQTLWIRDNPGKTTGGTRRQPSAGAATPTDYEMGYTKHMRGWHCPIEIFDLAAGGTGCTDGSHNPNVLGPVPEVDVMAKRPQGGLFSRNAGDSFRADGGAAFLHSRHLAPCASPWQSAL
jgi:hypothetical protein